MLPTAHACLVMAEVRRAFAAGTVSLDQGKYRVQGDVFYLFVYLFVTNQVTNLSPEQQALCLRGGADKFFT